MGKDHEVFNGTRGVAKWDGGEGPAAVNLIDGDWIMAIRGEMQPPLNASIDLMAQRWMRGVEVTATVRGMRTYRVSKGIYLQG